MSDEETVVRLTPEQAELLQDFDEACEEYVQTLKAAAEGGVPPEIIQAKMMETLQALGAPAGMMMGTG